MTDMNQQFGAAEHYYPTQCVLCPHNADTPEGHREHMEEAHR